LPWGERIAEPAVEEWEGTVGISKQRRRSTGRKNRRLIRNWLIKTTNEKIVTEKL